MASTLRHNPAMPVHFPDFFGTRRRLTFGHWLLKQTAIILGITLAVAAGLVLVFNQAVVPTLIYCLCISACCAVCVQLLRHAAAYAMHRLGRGGDAPGTEYWPGWPLMLVSLVV